MLVRQGVGALERRSEAGAAWGQRLHPACRKNNKQLSCTHKLTHAGYSVALHANVLPDEGQRLHPACRKEDIKQ